MTNIGLPVPPGFIISTATCLEFFESTPELPFGLVEEVAQAVKAIETQTGREFGNPNNPLLFSVRSGAAISMPGMMDTGACVCVCVCVSVCVGGDGRSVGRWRGEAMRASASVAYLLAPTHRSDTTTTTTTTNNNNNNNNNSQSCRWA
jgi:hypothetical protein